MTRGHCKWKILTKMVRANTGCYSAKQNLSVRELAGNTERKKNSKHGVFIQSEGRKRLEQPE